MPRVNYPTQKFRYPSPRSGLTSYDVAKARTAPKGAGTVGALPVKKSAAEEFRQAIRIDIGDLQMRAEDGNGSRFEAARKFCELQHSLVASTTASVHDRRAALRDIRDAVNMLDARFPGVFAAAKALTASARLALSVAQEIEDLRRLFEAADLEGATMLLEGRSARLALRCTVGPFSNALCEELSNCWMAVKAAHPDEQVRDLMDKHLAHYPSTGSGRAASSGPSASEIASLRAAEATKVTVATQTRAAPARSSRTSAGLGERRQASQHLPLPELNIAPSVANMVALVSKIDELLTDLSARGASDLGNRLILGQVADLIDQIVRFGNAAKDALVAMLWNGLGRLHLEHKDEEMRAEIDRALAYCFDQRGDNRAFTGERRLQMRVEFLITEGPGLPSRLKQCRDDFALKLVDDIKRELGKDSPLMLDLMHQLEGWPVLDQLRQQINQRLAGD